MFTCCLNMGFNFELTILKIGPQLVRHGISQERAAATTDHFADVYVHDMMDTLLRNEWKDFLPFC